jgi:hypothetical protein
VLAVQRSTVRFMAPVPDSFLLTSYPAAVCRWCIGTWRRKQGAMRGRRLTAAPAWPRRRGSTPRYIYSTPAPSASASWVSQQGVLALALKQQGRFIIVTDAAHVPRQEVALPDRLQSAMEGVHTAAVTSLAVSGDGAAVFSGTGVAEDCLALLASCAGQL